MKNRFKIVKGKVTDDGHVMLQEDIVKHMNDFYNYFLEKKEEVNKISKTLEEVGFQTKNGEVRVYLNGDGELHITCNNKIRIIPSATNCCNVLPL